MGISFLYPRFLLLLLLVPFFIFVYFFSFIYNKKRATIFANFEAMERFYGIEFFSKNFLALYVNLGILVLLILALSGMQLSFEADSSAFSYVIAIDTSGSMSANDVLPTRLDAAKQTAKEFIDSLPTGVDVGVVGFSGDATIMQSLTNSKLKSKIAIDQISFGNIEGTNVYNALIASNKVFGNKKMKSVILISDGQFNIGDTPQIINYAKRNGILINSIAVGTEEGGITKYKTISKADINFLKSLAFNSGGKFFMAGDSKSLRNSFRTLVYDVKKTVTLDLTFYLLLIAITLLTVTWILYNLRFKVIP